MYEVIFIFVEFDGSKDLFCDQYFPDGTSRVRSRVNDTMVYLTEEYIELSTPIDRILDTVVVAQIVACRKIADIVKSLEVCKYFQRQFMTIALKSNILIRIGELA